MAYKNKIDFVFVLLSPNSSINDLKTILYDKKIYSKSGKICLYTPFHELASAYEKHFPIGSKMFGIGFRLSCLKEKATFCNQNGQALNPITDKAGNLLRCIVVADKLDFSSLCFDKNEVIAVVPDLASMEDVCYRGVRENTNYKLWMWKGIRVDCCKGKKDDEIIEYLNDYRFYRDNHKRPSFKELFPCKNLVDDSETLPHTYKLLCLPPEELLTTRKDQPFFEPNKLF